MADHTETRFEYLTIPASELRVGDIIALGFKAANIHHVESVGTENYGEGRDFVTYTGHTSDGREIDAHVLPNLILDIRRNA